MIPHSVKDAIAMLADHGWHVEHVKAFGLRVSAERW